MCLCTGLQVHYKKKYEQTKAQYHLVVDTAEQRHHKDNALLLSQVHVNDARDSFSPRLWWRRLHNHNAVCLLVKVKYREEFERSRGASQMEFGDTQAYRVSREAQKMQSEVKTHQPELLAHSESQSVCLCVHTLTEQVLSVGAGISLSHTHLNY